MKKIFNLLMFNIFLMTYSMDQGNGNAPINNNNANAATNPVVKLLYISNELPDPIEFKKRLQKEIEESIEFGSEEEKFGVKDMIEGYQTLKEKYKASHGGNIETWPNPKSFQSME